MFKLFYWLKVHSTRSHRVINKIKLIDPHYIVPIITLIYVMFERSFYFYNTYNQCITRKGNVRKYRPQEKNIDFPLMNSEVINSDTS